jgi:hypothetical protein
MGWRKSGNAAVIIGILQDRNRKLQPPSYVVGMLHSIIKVLCYNTVIFRFTSFRLYEMHKLMPVFLIYEPIFANTSSFLSQIERCSRRLFSGSNGKLIFVLRVFVLRAVLEERIKLVNPGITVLLNGDWIPTLPLRVASIPRPLRGQMEPAGGMRLFPRAGVRFQDCTVLSLDDWRAGRGWLFVSIVSLSSLRDAVWPRIGLVLGVPAPTPTLWPYVRTATCRLSHLLEVEVEY